MEINNAVTGWISRTFYEGSNGTWISDWRTDPRNPNFETKIIRRSNGTFLLMGRRAGSGSEQPHISQEFDVDGNTDSSQDIHKKLNNFFTDQS